jgi:hypothetical protein
MTNPFATPISQKNQSDALKCEHYSRPSIKMQARPTRLLLHSEDRKVKMMIITGKIDAPLESEKIPADFWHERPVIARNKQGPRGHVFFKNFPVSPSPEYLPDYSES